MEASETEQSKKSARNMEQNRLAFAEQVRNIKIAEIDTEFDPKSTAALNDQLNEAKLFILGEVHGVKENADVIYTLFKKFGFKKLALEWDEKLLAVAERFIQTGELNFEAIQESSDGRITPGHFVLLKKLKDEGLLEALICFDEEVHSGEWNDRDVAMAKNILANVSGSRTLVVAGNLHTQVETVVIKGVDYHPMGKNLKKQVPNLPSGEIRYLRGQYHNYGTKDFPNELEDTQMQRAKFYTSDEGVYVFQLPEVHAAVVPNLKEASHTLQG